MSLPMYVCPYCGTKAVCNGCLTRHINQRHPDKRKEYIEKYLTKKQTT